MICADDLCVHAGGIDLSSEPNAAKIVVADGANHRVQVFDLDGNFQYSLGEEGHGPGQLQRPRDVCVTPKHDIVVADTGNDRIQIFNSDGSIAMLGLGPGSDPGQLRKPSGVAVSKDGRLVVADTGNNRIQIFNLNGTVEKVSVKAEKLPPARTAHMHIGGMLHVCVNHTKICAGESCRDLHDALGRMLEQQR